MKIELSSIRAAEFDGLLGVIDTGRVNVTFTEPPIIHREKQVVIYQKVILEINAPGHDQAGVILEYLRNNGIE